MLRSSFFICLIVNGAESSELKKSSAQVWSNEFNRLKMDLVSSMAPCEQRIGYCLGVRVRNDYMEACSCKEYNLAPGCAACDKSLRKECTLNDECDSLNDNAQYIWEHTNAFMTTPEDSVVPNRIDPTAVHPERHKRRIAPPARPGHDHPDRGPYNPNLIGEPGESESESEAPEPEFPAIDAALVQSITFVDNWYGYRWPVNEVHVRACMGAFKGMRNKTKEMFNKFHLASLLRSTNVLRGCRKLITVVQAVAAEKDELAKTNHEATALDQDTAELLENNTWHIAEPNSDEVATNSDEVSK